MHAESKPRAGPVRLSAGLGVMMRDMLLKDGVLACERPTSVFAGPTTGWS
jgi:hypothetical protein